MDDNLEHPISRLIATVDPATGKIKLEFIPDSVASGLKPRGGYDCSVGVYPVDPETGDFYWCTVAGTILSEDYNINDWLVCVDAVAPQWEKVDNSETGKVKANAGDATPGYLDAKVDGATIEISGTVLRIKDGSITSVKMGAEYRIPVASFASETDVDIAVQTGKHRIPIMFNGDIVAIRAMIETAPTGAPIVLDINKNGVTIFTTQGNRPTIAIGANDSGEVTNMDLTAIVKGDYLTLDIDQIGSTVAGQNLTLLIVGR